MVYISICHDGYVLDEKGAIHFIGLTSCCLPASNGNSRLPDSLHYIDPSGRPNSYQRVRNDFLFESPLLYLLLIHVVRICLGNYWGWRGVTVLWFRQAISYVGIWSTTDWWSCLPLFQLEWKQYLLWGEKTKSDLAFVAILK